MENFENAIAKYLEAIVADYKVFSSWGRNLRATRTETEIRSQMIEKFEKGIDVAYGKKYAKVTTTIGDGQATVHSFVVLEDDTKFKRGDILMAASWASPAKNKARGNIFGEYKTKWTGAEYLI
jgi:hypothetical protein